MEVKSSVQEDGEEGGRTRTRRVDGERKKREGRVSAEGSRLTLP